MKYKIILFIAVTIIYSFDINSDLEKFYVLNFYGSDLKEKPNFNSKTIESLKLGDSIFLIEKTNIKTEKKLFHNELYLRGEWSIVKCKNKTGFIFNGDYSKLKIKTKKLESDYLIADYGKPNSKIKTTKDFTYHNKIYKSFIVKENYDLFTEITTTSNSDVGKSCEIISSKLNINEMIHFMYLTLRASTDGVNGETIGYIHPHFQNFSNNVYLFDGPGSFQDIKIEKHKEHISFKYNM